MALLPQVTVPVSDRQRRHSDESERVPRPCVKTGVPGLFLFHFSTKIYEKTLLYCAISTMSVIMYFTGGSVVNFSEEGAKKRPGIDGRRRQRF